MLWPVDRGRLRRGRNRLGRERASSIGNVNDGGAPCRPPQRHTATRDAWTARRGAIAICRRMRALRQRPGAVAHLHRRRVIRIGARHEAGRHQQAARQGRQQQRCRPGLDPAVSCPALTHEMSLGQDTARDLGYPQRVVDGAGRPQACGPSVRASVCASSQRRSPQPVSPGPARPSGKYKQKRTSTSSTARAKAGQASRRARYARSVGKAGQRRVHPIRVEE